MSKLTKKVSHTPGPWVAGSGDNDGRDFIAIEHECFPLAEVRGTDDMSCIDEEDEPRIAAEMVANARLICAAPELLEALKKVNHAIQSSNMRGTILHDEVKRAIKKATVTDIEKLDSIIQEIEETKFKGPADGNKMAEIERLAFSEDLSIFDKIQRIQKLLMPNASKLNIMLDPDRIKKMMEEGKTMNFEGTIVVKTGTELIEEERLRQVEKEGWTSEHDDKHTEEELAAAAVCYASPEKWRDYYDKDDDIPLCWPWSKAWWKPTPYDRIKELMKAGALIAAEIDRLQRVESGQAQIIDEPF